jgi:hypothetical protein
LAGIFANAEGQSGEYAGYSANGGNNWTLVRPPKGVVDLSVAADPVVAGQLVATTDDTQFHPDRRWYSKDGGRHWTAGVCAGDYRAICPTAILPATTPGGVSVAIDTRGAFTFTGDGGADGRATIHLPVAARAVLDAQGDLKQGDAVYLLTRGGRNAATIYRSLNGGVSWSLVRYPAPRPS